METMDIMYVVVLEIEDRFGNLNTIPVDRYYSKKRAYERAWNINSEGVSRASVIAHPASLRIVEY